MSLIRWTSWLVILALASSLSLSIISPVEAKQTGVFSMNDPVGDDNGPGTYKYPMRSIFDPKKSLFDLTKFAVSMDDNNYYFDISLGLINNPWGAPEGFSQPIIEIYLDTKEGGRTETLNEGAYVNFNANHGWEYLIKVVSWSNTAVYTSSDHPNTNGQREKIKVKVLPDKKTIRVAIPQKYIKEEPDSWEYYVLVGSQDGLGPDNFRMVMEKPSEWQFGGGTDTNYDPNVIDLLAPPDGPDSQKNQLTYYIKENQIAEVKPIIPTEKQMEAAESQSSWYHQIQRLIKSVNDKFPLSQYYPAYTAVILFIIVLFVFGWVNFGSLFKDEDK